MARRRYKFGRPRGSTRGSRMINDLRAYHRELLQQRESLDARLGAVETALGAMGGAISTPSLGARRGPSLGASRKRAERGSLKKSLMKVLGNAKGPVQVKDMISGIKRVGYKTRSRSLGSQISMALRTMPGLKKVSHGVYVLKK